MADLTGPNPDEVNGVDSRGVALTAKPVLVGARGSDVAPSAVTAGQAVDIWASLTGAQVVDGGIAHDAVDSGNPLKIGGRAQSTVPTAVADGDRVNTWHSLHGELNIGLRDPSDGTQLATITNADGIQPVRALQVGSQGYVFDGTSTWNRWRQVAAADGQAITGLPAVGPFVFNGSTWDRARSGGVTGMQGIAGDVAHDAADAGYPQKIGGYASNVVPTSVAQADRVNAWFDLAGRQLITQKSATGTMTSVSAAVADTALLAANTARSGFTIHNDSTAILYLLVATGTASTTVFSVKMAAGGYYEAPPIGYTGQVRGYWAAANGSARITEYT